MTIVGVRRVDFDRDGRSYHGYKYFCTEPAEGVEGVVVDSFFASDRVLADSADIPNLGDEVIPVYKRDSKQLRAVIIDA